MASQFDTIFSSAVAALQACHGVSVTRWPGGTEGSAMPVPGCLWNPDETPQRIADMDREEIVHEGVLQVPESVDVCGDDVWVIGDDSYSTVTIGRVHAGLRNLILRHNDKLLTKRHRSNFY